MCYVNLSGAYINAARMSRTLNGSSVLQRFKLLNTIEIHNGTMFDFYLGLPHLLKVTLIQILCESPTEQDIFQSIQGFYPGHRKCYLMK